MYYCKQLPSQLETVYDNNYVRVPFMSRLRLEWFRLARVAWAGPLSKGPYLRYLQQRTTHSESCVSPSFGIFDQNPYRPPLRVLSSGSISSRAGRHLQTFPARDIHWK
jgi:hypothetical protein